MQDDGQEDVQDLLAQANVYLQRGHQFIKDADNNEENLTSFKGSLRQKAQADYYQSHEKLLKAFKKGNQSAYGLLTYNKKIIDDLNKTKNKLDGFSFDENTAKFSAELCEIYAIHEKQPKSDGKVAWKEVLRETILSPETIARAEESIFCKAKRRLTSSLKKVTNQ